MGLSIGKMLEFREPLPTRSFQPFDFSMNRFLAKVKGTGS